MQISAVILSGGKSSRMGRDKALLPFGSYSTMAEYQYRKLEKLFDRVYLSSKSDKFPFKADIIYDRYKSSSPLNAIISAFETLDEDAIFILAVDMPLVTLDIIDELVNLYTNNPNYDCYCYELNGRVEPTVAIYRRNILKLAKDNFYKNNHKLRALIEESKSLCAKNVNSEKFANLNYIEDYLNKKF